MDQKSIAWHLDKHKSAIYKADYSNAYGSFQWNIC